MATVRLARPGTSDAAGTKRSDKDDGTHVMSRGHQQKRILHEEHLSPPRIHGISLFRLVSFAPAACFFQALWRKVHESLRSRDLAPDSRAMTHRDHNRRHQTATGTPRGGCSRNEKDSQASLQKAQFGLEPNP